jgi:hypothetical protein
MGRGFNFATCLEGALVSVNSFYFDLFFYCYFLSESEGIDLHAQ